MKRKTNLIILSDVSGSRIGQESSDREGLETMIEKQRSECEKAGIECYLTLYRFNHCIDKVYDRVPIQEFTEIEMPTFGGGTSLYDCICEAIEDFTSDTNEGKIVCIVTDGLDTSSSKRNNSDRIKELIEIAKGAGWLFLYLSENVETMEAGEQLGIGYDPAGLSYNYSTGRGNLGEGMSSQQTQTALTNMLYTSSGYDPQ